MNQKLVSVAQQCMNAAYNNTMTFPEIIGTLVKNGFESYHVDYLRGTATYYHAEGGNVELTTPEHGTVVNKEFQVQVVQSAIKEAQSLVEGYTYVGFCKKVMGAGCAGYIVSFPGKRVVYFGRTAETHVEHFPR
jgi:uncharacterized protein YbcV (DUF1398 family)